MSSGGHVMDARTRPASGRSPSPRSRIGMRPPLRCSVLAGLMALEADRVRDILELRLAYGGQAFAAGGEFLGDFDGLLGHLLVRLRRAAHQSKIRSGGYPLVPIGVQPYAQQQRARPLPGFA